MLRYWKLMHSSGITENIVLASSEEEAIEILAREDRYLYDFPLERRKEVLRASIADGDDLLIPCGVGDRVKYIECGICAKHVDRGPGTVIAIGEDVYELEPEARERDIHNPVLVAWDSGARSVEDAIDLRAFTEA